MAHHVASTFDLRSLEDGSDHILRPTLELLPVSVVEDQEAGSVVSTRKEATQDGVGLSLLTATYAALFLPRRFGAGTAQADMTALSRTSCLEGTHAA